MIKSVRVPEHTKHGIRPALRDFPLAKNLRLFGADTETYKGLPHTLQINDGRETALFYVNSPDIFETFWHWLRPRMREGGVNICYFHYLNFDLRVLFAQYRKKMYEQFNEIIFHFDGNLNFLDAAPPPGADCIKVKMLFGKVNCATISEGAYVAGKKNIFNPVVKLDILDSFAFTHTSLEKSLKMYGIDQNKLPRPDGIGVKRLRSPEFEAYAKQDVVAERALGEKILAFHEEYKVRPSISISQFASRVFRRYFFEKDGVIQFPPEGVVKAAEFSYHAGKNGLYIDRPQIIEDVYELDINSAFPYAMANLPQFVKGAYIETREYIPDLCGVYNISGEVLGGKYPLVYDHEFKPVAGKFSGVWTTGYELEKMKGSPYIFFKINGGHVWKPSHYEKNSFKDYVEHFYAMKEKTPKASPYYNFYKIGMLNSLYGKLVSTIELRAIDKLPPEQVILDELTGKRIVADYRMDSATGDIVRVKREYKAGSLYNPFIASMITGKVRAMIYDMETKYQSLHTATDSVKTIFPVEKVPGLGGHKIECFGRCYFFRNKLYLHFSKTFEYCNHDKHDPTLLWDGEQHLCKSAFHGFKGPESMVFANRKALMETHHIAYDYKHSVGLREGLKRGETPCDFIKREEVLCLCHGKKTAKTCEKAKYRCHCAPVETLKVPQAANITRTK